MTKTFKNKHFTTRDYEATNIVYCESKINPNPENWIECDPSENTLGQIDLMYENGVDVRRFGYM